MSKQFSYIKNNLQIIILRGITMLKINSKNIFLIDGIGAIITATSLGVVLPYFQKYFGMPKNILFVLSAIALIFSIYSIFCNFLPGNKIRDYLKIICFANFTYCILSLILIIIYSEKLTLLGHIYFIGEIIIVLSLVIRERQIIKTI